MPHHVCVCICVVFFCILYLQILYLKFYVYIRYKNKKTLIDSYCLYYEKSFYQLLWRGVDAVHHHFYSFTDLYFKLWDFFVFCFLFFVFCLFVLVSFVVLLLFFCVAIFSYINKYIFLQFNKIRYYMGKIFLVHHSVQLNIHDRQIDTRGDRFFWDYNYNTCNNNQNN